MYSAQSTIHLPSCIVTLHCEKAGRFVSAILDFPNGGEDDEPRSVRFSLRPSEIALFAANLAAFSATASMTSVPSPETVSG